MAKKKALTPQNAVKVAQRFLDQHHLSAQAEYDEDEQSLFIAFVDETKDDRREIAHFEQEQFPRLLRALPGWAFNGDLGTGMGSTEFYLERED